MPFSVGPLELLLVLIVVLLIVGPGKLPEVGSAIGKSIREFRKASTDVQESLSVEPAGAKASTGRTVNPAVETAADVGEDRAAS